MAAIFGLLPVIAAANSDLIQVTAVRSWSYPDVTRIILQTTGPFEFKADRARNPDRLFFDILNARPLIQHKRFYNYAVGDRLVQRIRIAETAPGTTRVVFDLAAPARFSVTRLDTPDRMVIELRPAGTLPAAPATPVARVTPPESSRQPVTAPPVKLPAPAPPVTLSRTAHKRAPRRRFAYPAAAFLDPPAPREIQLLPAPLLTFDPQPRPLAFLADVMPAPPGASPAIVASASSTRVLPAVARLQPSQSTALAGANASRSLTRALGLKVSRIVIDAGHGGHDDGTIGPHGVLEKDVVLDVALRLSKLVQERMGAEVILTRSDDTFIPLHERTAIANAHKADLFLSIHANSSPAREVAGTETFFLNFTTSPGALDVAARENAGSEKNVGDLKDLIQSITLNDKIEESQTFAQSIQSSLEAQEARSNPNAHDRGIKKAPFVVLIGASMPSVLAEIGFLSNARDEANLNKPEYRQKVAEALYKGLSRYSASLSHFEDSRQVARAERTATGEGGVQH